MSDGTAISWSDATWSPVTGCTKTSEGCTHCYIDRTPPFRMAHRKFDGDHVGATTGVQLHSERLGIPMKWRKPRRIFVCSLADLFQDEVPTAFIAEVFAVMSLAPQHSFQVLTKRHARMRALLNSPEFWQAVDQARGVRGYEALPAGTNYLPNAWIGVSTESQKWADIRIPALLDTPAAVRWISAEPLLGPVDLGSWLKDPVFNPAYRVARCGQRSSHGPHVVEHGPDQPRNCPGTSGRTYRPRRLDWVVCGGESGPKARPMHPHWARQLRDQCVEAGVAFHYKQHGEWAATTEAITADDSRTLALHPAGMVALTADNPFDPFAVGHPYWEALRRVGKKAAGRELDGRTWDEYPTAPVAVTA